MHILEGNYGGFILINHVQFGSGKDVIFLHGWGGSISSFLGCAKRISKKYRVTLVDFYGFGETKALPFPLYLDDYVNSIVDIIRYYKMDSAIIVGHSFGGRVAIRLASKYGYLLDKVVLVDSAGIKPRRTLKYYAKIFLHKLCIRLHINHVGGSEDYKKLSNVMKQTFKNIVNEDQTYELSKITLPIMLVWGDKDRDTPIYMAKRILHRIPQSFLVILKNSGHFAYVERHSIFTRILIEFLEDDKNEVDNSKFDGGIYKRRIIKVSCDSSKK